GGKSWKKLAQGLPKAKLGRIGFDWSRKNPNLVFDLIDTEEAGKGLPPTKAFVGIAIENTDKGVRIRDVAKDSPAAKAKIAPGDLLITLDGKAVKTTNDFLLPMQKHAPGDKIKIGYE